MADFKKLLVWQKAHAMAMDVETMGDGIRGSRHASLRSQIVRAAASVRANIVEGSGEQTAANFSRFLRIALNSSTELEYHLIVASDRKLISAAHSLTLRSQVIEVRKMLYGLRRHLASRSDAAKEP